MERLVDARVQPEVVRHPDLVAHAGDGEEHVSHHGRRAEVADDRETAAVPGVGAHIDALAYAVTSEDVYRMALIEIAPKVRVGGGVHGAGVPQRIGDPAAQPVGAAPLESELDSARVAAQRVAEDGTELRVENGTSRTGEAEFARGRVDPVANLPVVRLHPESNPLAQRLLQSQREVRDALGPQRGRAELAKQIDHVRELSVLAGRRGQLSAASRRHGQADPGQEGGLGVLAEMVPASAHDQVHSLAGERNRVLEVRPRLGDGLGEQRGLQEGAGELLRGIVPRLVLQIVSIQPPEDRPGLKLVPVPGLMGQILAQAHLAAARTLQQVHRRVLVPLRVAGAVDLSLRNGGRVRPRPPEAGQFAAAVAVLQPVEAKDAVGVLGNRRLAVDDAERDPVALRWDCRSGFRARRRSSAPARCSGPPAG